MSPELKQKWIDALRSGKYEQTREGVLRDGDAFCCLGVLCDVVAPGGWLDHPKGGVADSVQTHRFAGVFSEGSGCIDHSMLNVRKARLGLRQDFADRLTRMNDGTEPGEHYREYSFPEIADYIEANL